MEKCTGLSPSYTGEWMLAADGESCGTACVRTQFMACYLESMLAINDFTKWTYVADKLFLTGPDAQYACSQKGVLRLASHPPGFSTSSSCVWSDGVTTSCDSAMPSYQRFCCCGNSNNQCQLEYANLDR